MAHFRKLAIRGYRSIKSANIQLGEVTVIIGPSDTGKSNVVRAIRDWSDNPRGHSFMRMGSSTTRVAVAIGPESKIIWEKRTTGHKSRNDKTLKAIKGRGMVRYVYHNSASGDSLVYEKTGNVVPKEIQDITLMRDFIVGDDFKFRPNISEQGDPWFLISSSWTPSMVARIVGKISGLDALLSGVRDIRKDILKNKSLAGSHKGNIVVLTKREEEYSWLDEARELLSEAESKQKAVERLKKRENAVQELSGRLRRSISRMSKLKKLIKKTRGVEDSIRDLLETRKAFDDANALSGLVWEMTSRKEKIQGKISRLAEELDSELDKIETLGRDGELTCDICGEPQHDDCEADVSQRIEKLRYRKNGRGN